MNKQPTASITEHFASLEDPRIERTKLHQLLEITGCMVTIDALGCQTEIAQAIVERDANYVLAVKENQGHLYEDIKGLFDAAQEVNFKDVPHAYAKTTDKGHGRLEIRQCWTIADAALVTYLRNYAGWRNLRKIVKVVSERCLTGVAEISGCSARG